MANLYAYKDIFTVSNLNTANIVIVFRVDGEIKIKIKSEFMAIDHVYRFKIEIETEI